jgi:hypothetical protein
VPKYYFTQLASRPLVLSGKPYRFLICSQMAGRSSGVYMAESEEEIRVMDDAVRARRGVKEIGAEEYEELKKKATRQMQSVKSGGSKPKLVFSPKTPPLRLAENAPGVASEAKKAAEEAMLVAPPVTTLINVEKVGSPRPFSTSDTKVSRAVKRADRAKVRLVQPSVDQT